MQSGCHYALPLPPQGQNMCVNINVIVCTSFVGIDEQNYGKLWVECKVPIQRHRSLHSGCLIPFLLGAIPCLPAIPCCPAKVPVKMHVRDWIQTPSEPRHMNEGSFLQTGYSAQVS